MFDRGAAVRTIDPLVVQAEKILAQRQERNLLIDPDLLGEPGWDILLSVFIAGGKGMACRVGDLSHDLDLPLHTVQRWVGLLERRNMVEANDNLVALTHVAETTMRTMFKAQLKDLVREIGLHTKNFTQVRS